MVLIIVAQGGGVSSQSGVLLYVIPTTLAVNQPSPVTMLATRGESSPAAQLQSTGNVMFLLETSMPVGVSAKPLLHLHMSRPVAPFWV